MLYSVFFFLYITYSFLLFPMYLRAFVHTFIHCNVPSVFMYSVFLTNCHTTNFSWVPMIYTNCTSVVFLPFQRLGRFSHRLSRRRRYLLRRLAFHSPRDSILHLLSFFLAYHHALTVSALLKADLFTRPFIRR